MLLPPSIPPGHSRDSTNDRDHGGCGPACPSPPPDHEAARRPGHRADSGPASTGISAAYPAAHDGGGGGGGGGGDARTGTKPDADADSGCDGCAHHSAMMGAMTGAHGRSGSYDSEYEAGLDSHRGPHGSHHHDYAPPFLLYRATPSSDQDMDMSDSDGGAPLDEILAAIHGGDDGSDDDGSDDDDDDDGDDGDAIEPVWTFPPSSVGIPGGLGGTPAHGYFNGDEPPVPPALHPNSLPPPFPFSPHMAASSANTAHPINAWLFDPGDAGLAGEAFPPLLSNPNPTILGSTNLCLMDYLRDWVHQSRFSRSSRRRSPHLDEVYRQARAGIKEVRYADLRGDECDMQGLNWTAMQTTRSAARAARLGSYQNYVNRQGSDKWTPRSESRRLPSRDSFFRFKRMDFRPDASLAHFQLRSVLACPSRSLAFYPSPSGISRLNLRSKKTDVVVNLRQFPALGGGVISTLDANCGVLMGGTFNGDYCLRSLDSDDKASFSEGQISPDGITNHLRIHTPRRNARPLASIASNDRGLRVMDIETETIVSRAMFPFCLNCSASSPDRRLQVVVGDSPKVLIASADTGEILQELSGHRDYGFACDWSDDGWTVATGFQDKAIKIWDARKWCNSSGASAALCTVQADMAGVRGLRFSSRGSGKPVLVAAEEADYISLIDAQTFCSKQTIDVFGEIGGIDFTNDGQDLNVLCCDPHRGGLLQLERCGRGPEQPLEKDWLRRTSPYPWLVRRGGGGGGDDDDDDGDGGGGGDGEVTRHGWSRHRTPTLLDGPGPF